MPKLTLDRKEKKNAGETYDETKRKIDTIDGKGKRCLPALSCRCKGNWTLFLSDLPLPSSHRLPLSNPEQISHTANWTWQQAKLFGHRKLLQYFVEAAWLEIYQGTTSPLMILFCAPDQFVPAGNRHNLRQKQLAVSQCGLMMNYVEHEIRSVVWWCWVRLLSGAQVLPWCCWLVWELRWFGSTAHELVQEF